ncbi:family 6 glucosyltransferase [Chitinophaga sp. 22620]|uniref:family 6 glucosyltransferase n=1 Tax=Chitinophaga sp. 22620 TaxID=3453952 RepID=UPI003F825A26
MKIALLYICTGKYKVFWDEFFTSSEQYFIPGAEKEYFVFTDATDLPYKDHPRVHVIAQEWLAWPYATLMRFHIFSRVEAQLENFEYIFFFNANAQFLRTVSAEEFLPGPEHGGLTVVSSPGFHGQPVKNFPYEKKDKRSKAYMPPALRKIYVQGGVNGGTAAAYLALIRELKDNVQADLDKGIIAEWHDESHLNRYIAERRPKVLSPAYIFPEERKDLPFEPVILIRDKNRLGGNAAMRQHTDLHPRPGIAKRILRRVRNWFS